MVRYIPRREHHKSEYPATTLEISAASFTAMDVRISYHKPRALYIHYGGAWWQWKSRSTISCGNFCDPRPVSMTVWLIRRNEIQFSSHLLLTCWLNSTSVNYSAHIQHKYKKTKQNKTKQNNDNNINQLLTWQPPTWIDHITLRYITLPMPTQQPQTVHMTNTNCTLTHTTYYRVKNTAEWQENT
jgi:hypothetical protein